MYEKKYMIVSIILCLSGVMLIMWSRLFFETGLSRNDYQENIRMFDEVDLKEIKYFQEEKRIFYLYVGRESCPYCVDFVAALNGLKLKDDLTIYYLDSIDSYENSSLELKEFRDNYGIVNVPSLILFEGDEKIADLKDNIFDGSDEDVMDFLELHKLYDSLNE